MWSFLTQSFHLLIKVHSSYTLKRKLAHIGRVAVNIRMSIWEKNTKKTTHGTQIIIGVIFLPPHPVHEAWWMIFPMWEQPHVTRMFFSYLDHLQPHCLYKAEPMSFNLAYYPAALSELFNSQSHPQTVTTPDRPQLVKTQDRWMQLRAACLSSRRSCSHRHTGSNRLFQETTSPCQ